jgi:serine/threonine protein kinase
MLWPNNKELKKGEYTILEQLGVGRFGITYKVKNRQGNLFVIKVPILSGIADQDARQMEKIIQESNKLAKFNHPNIVKFKETFQEDGICCVVMEFINGTTLDKEPEKLSEELALKYIKQVGQALIVVHDRGLLHRDIRPGNIIIRAGKPEAILIDFGLALDFDAILTRTRPEEMTVGYAPIECYDRQQKRDTYTDIYSLGATLYFLLTHEVPTSAEERKSKKRLIELKAHNPSISDTTNTAILSAIEFGNWYRLIKVGKSYGVRL